MRLFMLSSDFIKSDVSLWTPTHRHTSVGQPAKTGYHLEDLVRCSIWTNGEIVSEDSMLLACLDCSLSSAMIQLGAPFFL